MKIAAEVRIERYIPAIVESAIVEIDLCVVCSPQVQEAGNEARVVHLNDAKPDGPSVVLCTACREKIDIHADPELFGVDRKAAERWGVEDVDRAKKVYIQDHTEV